MLKFIPIAIVAFALAACVPDKTDETVSGYTKPGAEYHLMTLNGVAFAQEATIQFPEEGKVTGRGPCNGYSGLQNTYYPWFEFELTLSTTRTCPEENAEAAFLASLHQMSFAEVSGDVLLLTGEGGGEMTFEAR